MVSRWFFSVSETQEFYPSITEELLQSALLNINEKGKETIFHSRKSLLYYNIEPWRKNHGNQEFDVTMGNNEGAEAGEIVGF